MNQPHSLSLVKDASLAIGQLGRPAGKVKVKAIIMFVYVLIFPSMKIKDAQEMERMAVEKSMMFRL